MLIITRRQSAHSTDCIIGNLFFIKQHLLFSLPKDYFISHRYSRHTYIFFLKDANGNSSVLNLYIYTNSRVYIDRCLQKTCVFVLLHMKAQHI